MWTTSIAEALDVVEHILSSFRPGAIASLEEGLLVLFAESVQSTAKDNAFGEISV